jgi:ribosomal protein S28E/S33
MMEAAVIGFHGRVTNAVKVRLSTGEELWCNRHVVDVKVPLRVGDVIKDVRLEYTRIIAAKLKKAEPST